MFDLRPILLWVISFTILCRVTIHIFRFSQMQALFFNDLRWCNSKSHRALPRPFQGRFSIHRLIPFSVWRIAILIKLIRFIVFLRWRIVLQMRHIRLRVILPMSWGHAFFFGFNVSCSPLLNREWLLFRENLRCLLYRLGYNTINWNETTVVDVRSNINVCGVKEG